MDKIQSAPVVFLQYLSAMAVVRGIKNYAKGYEKIPVKLKWPNDICKSQVVYYINRGGLLMDDLSPQMH